jgi:hypothetical protein
VANKLKTDLWKKAYLIEFVAQDGSLIEAFTFSVPPESEEITYSQRKSETKTFGGLHVDDYGMDAVKIVLSGSTVNQDLKKIYDPKTTGADQWMTGEQEIYYLRDLLKKHKTGEGLAAETRIMLYDLSKMNYIKGESGNTIKNYWQVFPGDFKIRRSSDRPFAYKYSIEFTAVDFEDETNMKDILAPKLEFARKAIDKLNKGLATLEKGMKKIEQAQAKLEELNTSIRDVMALLDAYSDVLLGYVDGITNMSDTVNDVLNIPGDITKKCLNIGLEFMNAGKRLFRSIENVTDTFLAIGTAEYWAPKEILDEYKMTAEEYADTWKDLLNGLEDTAYDISATGKYGLLPALILGDFNQETGLVDFTFYYGNTVAAINSTDTLESLANKYYGDPDRAGDIALYNGVSSIDELKPGDTIKIPTLTAGRRNTYNRIFARPEDRDNYGRDIYLDDEGNIAASAGGDYRLTEGVDNLKQAILLRLRESVLRRVRLATYGIRTNISDPTAGVAYIVSSIDSTVRMEPRVSEITGIKFTGGGDGLNVTVDYTDINHASGSAAGRA